MPAPRRITFYLLTSIMHGRAGTSSSSAPRARRDATRSGARETEIGKGTRIGGGGIEKETATKERTANVFCTIPSGDFTPDGAARAELLADQKPTSPLPPLVHPPLSSSLSGLHLHFCAPVRSCEAKHCTRSSLLKSLKIRRGGKKKKSGKREGEERE